MKSVSELWYKMTQKVDEHIVKFIVYGSHSFCIIEDEYFQKLLTLFNYKAFSHQS